VRPATKITLSLTALAASFILGFLAHRSFLQNYLKPPVSSALGKNRCGLWKGYSGIRDANDPESARLRAQSALLETTPEGLEHWRTPLGEFWNPKGNSLFYALAEQSLRNYGDGPYRVKAGDIVLDCGSNIGDFIREALSAGAKTVVAIEPVPRNVAAIQRTFAAEIAAGTVKVVPKAVWHEAGTMKMAVHENTLLDTLTGMNTTHVTGQIEVPLVTIDSLVAELGLPRVNFIKMDIEGAEPNALRGARQTIAAYRPQMSIATEHSPGEYGEVRDIILKTARYEDTCGPCMMTGFDFYPEVTFFTPR
jgi:FkbM family methyltransferase